MSRILPSLLSPGWDIVSEGNVDSVLLVEDDDDVRMALAETLKAQAFPVIEAASSEAALNIIRGMGATMEWLITDTHVGPISSLHVAFEFRFLHPTRPIVFMSGHELPPEFARMNDVVTLRKPFSSKEFLGVMGALRSSRNAAATLGM